MTHPADLLRRLERSALLAILALPVLFLGLGAWEAGRGAATRAGYAGTVRERANRVLVLEGYARDDPTVVIRLPNRRSVPAAAAATAAAAERDTAAADLLVARAREGAAWLALLSGLAAGSAGLAGMALASGSARRGLRSRALLADGFGRVVRVLPAVLAVQVAGPVLALLGVVAFEGSALRFERDPDDKAVLLALLGVVCVGLAAWGGVGTLRALRRASRAFVPAPVPLRALPVTEADAPGLFALLRDLVREGGAAMPDVVAAGTEHGFFMSAGPVRLCGDTDAGPVDVRGTVLHLPLPLMATLDREELRTVLAHELAYFPGGDAGCGARLQTLRAALDGGARAMSVRRTVWGSLRVDRLLEHVVHPHTALALHARDRFGHAAAHWNRLRDGDADRAAAAAGPPAALASALLRLGLASDLLRAELDRIAEQPDAAPSDLAATVAARMGRGAGNPAAHLDDRPTHPTDTRSTVRQRLDAAGVVLDAALLARAARPVAPGQLAAVQGLFDDWHAVSRGVTEAVRAAAAGRHREHRDKLHQAADAPLAAETALRASPLHAAVILGVSGAVCLLVAVACVLSARYGGAEDREAFLFLDGVAAVSAVLLGLVLAGAARLWRNRKREYLVLTAEGIRSPGFAGTLRWLDVQGVVVSAVQSPTTSFTLRPGAALPRRTGAVRRLQVNRKQHAVQLMGLLPRGLAVPAFRELLMAYGRAAHARHDLERQATE